VRFEFATATRIVFGAGTHHDIPSMLAGLGSHVVVVTGHSPARAAAIVEACRAAGLAVTSFRVEGEPTIETVTRGVEHARRTGTDVVLSVGGGSAIDAGKAIAALLANGGSPLDYLEVIGRGHVLTRPSVPFVAVPTTAGTGAEVTRNAVLQVGSHRVKASLRSPLMLPRIALVDPTLMLDMPPAVTATTGLDALAQLIEPFLGVRANPLTDACARDGMPRVAWALERAWRDGADLAARTDMAMAGLLGGLCLANAGLGAVHGLAAPLGGMFPAPHGALCAALLAPVLEVNLRALRARQPDSPALSKADEVARLLTGDSQALAAAGVEWLAASAQTFAIPRLGQWGVTPADLPEIAKRGAEASSMKGNPIALTHGELVEILARAL
jgi:alcohol dehydrogenase class IV